VEKRKKRKKRHPCEGKGTVSPSPYFPLTPREREKRGKGENDRVARTSSKMVEEREGGGVALTEGESALLFSGPGVGREGQVLEIRQQIYSLSSP